MDNPYYEKLINAALRFVSFRPRSEKELTDFLLQKLKRWKVEGTVLVGKVVERMGELGYVDDRKFADWWVAQRRTFKHSGLRLIRFELAQKGVDPGVADAALSRYADEEIGQTEVQLACQALAKKFVLWASLPRNEYKKKVYTFLTQRGFAGDVIGQVIDGKGEKE